VPLAAARKSRLLNSAARFGARAGVAGLLLFAASVSLQNASAEGETRTLTFHHLHTGENITITYMRDGRYDDAALKKLDWFMRDWRKSQSTHMDPQLFDVLWHAYRELGATQPIEVVCGYRAPATNAMLRARSKSSGVAEFSQHTLGHAMDFYIPGVNLEKLREIGMRLQAGGVGFYPTSGSPFVHMDTGSIRHWPRMTYAQLTRVFPDGKTVHIPADGEPLPRYEEARAEVLARGGTVAGFAAYAQAGPLPDPQPRRKSFWATLFGLDDDENEDAEEIRVASRPSRAIMASRQPQPQPQPAAPAVAEDAKKVADKVSGWVYEIPDYKYEGLFKPVDQLVSSK